MPPFLFRCPNTGDNVQAWADDEPDHEMISLAFRCVALGKLVHDARSLVPNPITANCCLTS
jgi:hypothetical protein